MGPTVQQGLYMGLKEFIWDPRSLYGTQGVYMGLKEFIWYCTTRSLYGTHCTTRSLYGTQGVYMGPTVQQGVYYWTAVQPQQATYVYGIGVKQAVFIGLAKFVLHIN